jgi:hypothetical protein
MPPGSPDNHVQRGVVKCPLDIQEGTQRHLFTFERLLQSVNNVEKICFGRHTRRIGELVPVKWFLNQNTAPDVSIK